MVLSSFFCDSFLLSTLMAKLKPIPRLLILENKIENRKVIMVGQLVGWEIRSLIFWAFTSAHSINGTELAIRPVHLFCR